MPVLTLYKFCLLKIAINLREQIYKSCQENPFSGMPSKFINDIMSAALDHQRANEFRAEDLEQLLSSGQLRELKIPTMGDLDLVTILRTLLQILNFLNKGCQKLEIFSLLWSMQCYRAWNTSEASVARTRSGICVAQLRSEISVALENLFGNAHNLKDLHCSFSFDLKALRNCRKLRKLRLHFVPQQHWYEFLKKEKDLFQIHECLEFFTVCMINKIKRIPYSDVAIILQHCPEITSLGFIESSGALSHLHRMGVSHSELKLKHCYWRDIEYDCGENYSQPPDYSLNRVREAILNVPLIEELDFDGCCLKSMPYLKNLRNLVYLNFALDDPDSDTAFNDVLEVIGLQLKHLCFRASFPIDLSLILQKCHNLESLRIDLVQFTEFGDSSVSLPNLQRLTFGYRHANGKQFFRLLCDCNQLSELFLLTSQFFDDQTMHNFIQRNSLSNLKVACLPCCGLTEDGIRELLLNASQLEKANIFSSDFRKNYFERVIIETGHKALCTDVLLTWADEFFEKRRKLYDS